MWAPVAHNVSATVEHEAREHSDCKGSVKIPSALLTHFYLQPVYWKCVQHIVTLEKAEISSTQQDQAEEGMEGFEV